MRCVFTNRVIEVYVAGQALFACISFEVLCTFCWNIFIEDSTVFQLLIHILKFDVSHAVRFPCKRQ